MNFSPPIRIFECWAAKYILILVAVSDFDDFNVNTSNSAMNFFSEDIRSPGIRLLKTIRILRAEKKETYWWPRIIRQQRSLRQ